MFDNRDELAQSFEKHDGTHAEKHDGKLDRKADKKAVKKRRRTRQWAAEIAAYSGLGVVVLAEPWLLLLLVVPALVLALRD
ncbi:hypothetical protein PUR61_08225 [Streptomyces sp. BE20]|uniref:hypothetical protein n=1 Tax=unclassified Streptomyces TaxID=2593676 RepID=UPI002E76E0CA|nr:MULTISPECIES: hypothetical protein [unclassified Streptomyces]MED7951116.1 hypothetical protein [Streptomyces sp. BE303]MEE1822180.1 hypothetical protein [Streptomyces sp. BE20]